MTVSPLTLTLMLACHHSVDPENEVGGQTWGSSAGQRSRGWLRQNELIDDQFRSTELGKVWVESMCQTKLPVPTAVTASDAALARVIDECLAQAGLSPIAKAENTKANLGITPALALARMMRFHSSEPYTGNHTRLAARVSNKLMENLSAAAMSDGSWSVSNEDAYTIVAEINYLRGLVEGAK